MEYPFPFAIEDGPSCLDVLQILRVNGSTSSSLTVLVSRTRRISSGSIGSPLRAGVGEKGESSRCFESRARLAQNLADLANAGMNSSHSLKFTPT